MFDEEPETRSTGRGVICRRLLGFFLGPEEAACFLTKRCPEEGRYVEGSR